MKRVSKLVEKRSTFMWSILGDIYNSDCLYVDLNITCRNIVPEKLPVFI